MSRIQISTDGATKPTTSTGGWAAVIRTEDGRQEISGRAQDTTISRMELRAILEGLKAVGDGENVLLRTDSEYALGVAFRGNTIRTNGELVEAIQERAEALNVECEHVESHAGDTDNGRADALAKEEMKRAHEKITGGEAPYLIGGDVTGDDAEEVKSILKDHGLRWDVEAFGWVTWDREKWEAAVKDVGADMETERKAVV